MTSPTAAAGGSGDAGDSAAIMGDYLDELAAAYPEVRSLPAFGEAKDAADSLRASVTITAALDLSAAPRDLAVHFDDRPDATLFPESLAGTAEAQQARREITATFEQLPADLDALASVLVRMLEHALATPNSPLSAKFLLSLLALSSARKPQFFTATAHQHSMSYSTEEPKGDEETEAAPTTVSSASLVTDLVLEYDNEWPSLDS